MREQAGILRYFLLYLFRLVAAGSVVSAVSVVSVATVSLFRHLCHHDFFFSDVSVAVVSAGAVVLSVGSFEVDAGGVVVAVCAESVVSVSVPLSVVSSVSGSSGIR